MNIYKNSNIIQNVQVCGPSFTTISGELPFFPSFLYLVLIFIFNFNHINFLSIPYNSRTAKLPKLFSHFMQFNKGTASSIKRKRQSWIFKICFGKQPDLIKTNSLSRDYFFLELSSKLMKLIIWQGFEWYLGTRNLFLNYSLIHPIFCLIKAWATLCLAWLEIHESLPYSGAGQIMWFLEKTMYGYEKFWIVDMPP